MFMAMDVNFMLSLAALFLGLALVLADRCGRDRWRVLDVGNWGRWDVSLVSQTITKGVGLLHILIPFWLAWSRGFYRPHEWGQQKNKIRRLWIPESSWEGKLPADLEYLHWTVLEARDNLLSAMTFWCLLHSYVIMLIYWGILTVLHNIP